MDVKEIRPVQEKVCSFFVTVFCRSQECRLQPAIPLGWVWAAIWGPVVSMRLAHFFADFIAIMGSCLCASVVKEC